MQTIKLPRLFWAYLRRHARLIALFAVFSLVFGVVFALYDLPVEAVAYAGLLCLLLGLFQLAPFCMYSMQGIGAGTLVNDLTVNAVEPGQILMMGAGSASGSSANQKVLAFSVEIGLPLLIGAMLALYAALQKPEPGTGPGCA